MQTISPGCTMRFAFSPDVPEGAKFRGFVLRLGAWDGQDLFLSRIFVDGVCIFLGTLDCMCLPFTSEGTDRLLSLLAPLRPSANVMIDLRNANPRSKPIDVSVSLRVRRDNLCMSTK